MVKSGDDEYLKGLEAQRRAFEAQFGSLESMGFDDKTKDISKSDSEEEEVDEDEESGEISGPEQDGEDVDDDDDEVEEEVQDQREVQVVEQKRKPKVFKFQETHTDSQYIAPSKKDQKLVRSGKTLTQVKKSEIKKQMDELDNENNNDSDENEETEKENLENDLQLQQFLRESHLLSSLSNSNNSNTSGVNLTLQNMSSNNSNEISYQDDMLMGKARAKTLEMRLKRLSKTNGNSNKINKLEKVPIQIRKGMVKSHVNKIAKYEQDAKDGGIVLAKVKKGQFRKIDATYKKDIERRIGSSIKSKDEERASMRKRGLKINSVGRSTRNGLVISKQEIARINGTNNISKGGKGKFKGKKNNRR